MLGIDIQTEFVVAATEVLDEGVPGADHPCAAESSEAAHRSQPGLPSTVIGVNGVDDVLLVDVPGGGQQLIKHSRVSLCPIGDHLGRSPAMPQHAGEESAGGPPARSRFSAASTSRSCPN